MLFRATVVSIDRANGFVNVAPSFSAGRGGSIPTQQGTILQAIVRDAKWPPPLSQVYVDRRSPSVYELKNSISTRRELLHDDFISAVNPAASTQGQFGDTPWRLTNLFTNAYGQLGGTGNAQGVGVLVANGGAAGTQCLAKDNQSILIAHDPAHWFSANISTSTPSLSIIQCGLGADDARLNLTAPGANDAQAAFVYDTADGAAKLQTASGPLNSSLLLPFTPSAGTFFDFDIIVSADDGNASGFASIWINGDGPYTTTSFVPPITLGYEPYFGVTQQDATQKDIRVDWIHVETVSPVVNPDFLFR